jgi:hypothetical protein
MGESRGNADPHLPGNGRGERWMRAITCFKGYDAELPRGLIYRENCFSEALEREIILGIEQLGLGL